MPQIKIIGERVLSLDPAQHPDRPSLEDAARREMDHAPDLLYDSGDTVYRFEIVDDEAPAAAAAPRGDGAREPEAVIARIEALLGELRAALGR